jgi:hypothetical protein
MTNLRNEDQPNKFSSVEAAEGFVLRGAAAGDLPNERVKVCYTCRNRGHPHEAIILEKIDGRLLTNGTYEAVGWRLRNYFDSRLHQHKPRKEIVQ